MEEGKVDEMKVMVAIDGSECSHYALQWVLENLGHIFSNSKLIIFYVLSPDYLGYAYASTYGTAPPELILSLQENQKKVALNILENAKKTCAQQGNADLGVYDEHCGYDIKLLLTNIQQNYIYYIVAETLMESGFPKDEICEAVTKLNIRLLVLGSHGWGGLKRALLGSISDYCVHNAKCPVLVARKQAQ